MLSLQQFAQLPIQLPRSCYRVFFWAALLFSAYAAFSESTAPPIPYLDKILHGLCFFVLSLLLHYAYFESLKLNIDSLAARLSPPYLATHAVSPALLLFSYGLFIEVVQSFLPYRDASLPDLITDLFGIGLYYLLSGKLQLVISPLKADNSSP